MPGKKNLNPHVKLRQGKDNHGNSSCKKQKQPKWEKEQKKQKQ